MEYAYFEGQKDAFEQLLIEVKNLRYEFESSTKSDEEERAADSDESTPVDDAEALLDAALASDVITRKTSYYFHENKKILYFCSLLEKWQSGRMHRS